MKTVGLDKKYCEALSFEKKQLEIAFDGEIEFKNADNFFARKEGSRIIVGYSETCEIYRGFSFADRVFNEDIKISQKSRASRRGIMLDCCRNGVMNTASVKEFIINAAAMGYNLLILYVEDIYKIPEYRYFGHKRGAYTDEEIKEFVSFAKLFGMDLTLHIQTLGHLSIIKDWPCFEPLFDIDGVMLADEAATYEFIENEIKAVRKLLDYDYLFIGMDEAYNVGRGKYLDKYGPVDRTKLFLRHLKGVCEIAKKYNFKPVVATDMFFNMLSGEYWSDKTKLTKQVVDMMPENMVLEYWDYYYLPDKSGVIENMCKTHVATTRETFYACGAWNWHGITPKNYYSNFVTPNAVKIAINSGIDTILVFTFGDDGAECPAFSVLPSIMNTAELLYGVEDSAELNKRSFELFGISYDDFLKIDTVGRLGDEYDFIDQCPSTLEKSVLYNDVMMGLMNANINEFSLSGKYRHDGEILRSVKGGRYEILFETQAKYADFLEINWHLSTDIKNAYKQNDKKALEEICKKVIPNAITALEEFETSFNKQWHKYYKPFGFDIQQLRLGGAMLRLKDSAKRISDYLNGDIARLEELECEDLLFYDKACGLRGNNSWRRAFTRSDIGW